MYYQPTKMEQVKEQMMERLLTIMVKIKACQEWTIIKMDAWLEGTKAWREATEACLGNKEDNQEDIRLEIETGLEEMKAAETEAN
jgi:hypothetical protein